MSLFLDDETYRSLLTNTSIHAELTRLREEVSAQKEWTRRAVDEATRLREEVRALVAERDKAVPSHG
jgi:hypothetical protein